MSKPTAPLAAVKPRSSYHTNAVGMASALRGLADLLDTLGDVEFAETALSVNLQVIAAPHSEATEAERASTARLIAGIVTDDPEPMEYHKKDRLYSLKYPRHRIDGIDFSTYGQMANPASAPTGSRAVPDPMPVKPVGGATASRVHLRTTGRDPEACESWGGQSGILTDALGCVTCPSCLEEVAAWAKRGAL